MPHKLNLSIQWHITTACGHRCDHCYMYDPLTWPAERDDTLSLGDLFCLLDSFCEFEQKWDVNIGHFAITGGDPLLRKDWKELVRELRKRGKTISMMGNPETLTGDNIAALVELGVKNYQLSLEGLEPNHDRFRKDPGTFRRTIEKLALLKQAGIRCNVMFTLFPTNADELIPLLRFVAEQTEAASFSFDVGVFVGNAAGLNRNFTPQELKSILAGYNAEKKRLEEAGSALGVAEKCSFHQLNRFEAGEFYPYCVAELSNIGGCLIGWDGVAVLSDGTVLGCRRLPSIQVGRMPEQSFEEIFLGSPILRQYRRREFFEGCGECDFYMVCRGCPANVYSLTGNPLAKNPLCYRRLIDRQTDQSRKIPAGPPLDISYEAEFAWITGNLSTTLGGRFEAYLEDEILRELFVDLAFDLEQRRSFLTDPEAYLREVNAALPDEQRAFLMLHFSEQADDREIPVNQRDEMAEAMFARMLQTLKE
jgi:radical SAM protein with 4Fe4S-binding SPASM domain